MAKLKVSDAVMRTRGYRISSSKDSKTYQSGEFILKIKPSEEQIWTNGELQVHDVDLEELKYLEDIYK